MEHPFTAGKRGVCIFPVASGEDFFVPCQKMRILHDEAPVVVTQDGRIVDGRGRFEAARQYDLPVEVKVLP